MGVNDSFITKEQLYKFLYERIAHKEIPLSKIPDPILLKDGKKTAVRLAQAIKEKEKILVVGDYDVDGVVSTAIIKEFFDLIGYEIEVFIPNRFVDGYGVSNSIIQKSDADVIITVDNGISAIEAANTAKKKGIDLLITDHHTPSEKLPQAYSIVNPKQKGCDYPYKEICGAEVIWLVLALLKRELGVEINMRGFVDLLALAIIADIMPLIGMNRALVKDGLKALMYSQRSASIIIRDFLQKSKINAEDIAFFIAPRLNSAGRLEDASYALDFLLAKTPYEAYEAFEYLGKLNKKRKEIENQATQEAKELLKECNDDILVVAKEGWHEGVVGIVASRLCEHFAKPAIVLSINNEEAKGSARSVGEVDIFSLIAENKIFLEKFGGHKMAAGLGLKKENIVMFQQAIIQSVKQLDHSFFMVEENVIGRLSGASIDLELLAIIEEFEPYGEANERPKFLAQNLKVLEVIPFGIEKNHSKIRCMFEDETVHEFILFNKVYQKSTLSCSYKILRNEYKTQVNVQLLVDKIYES